MNKIHRVVWSEVRNCFVVASEASKAKGKPSTTRKAVAAAVAALFMAPGIALAVDVTTDETSQQIYADENVTIKPAGSALGSVELTSGGTAVVINPVSTYANTFTNNGAITVSGDRSAYGLVINNGVATGGSVVNTGSITADASDSEATAYGVRVNGDFAGTLNNSGAISATANASSSSASAYGVYIIGELSGSLTNSGSISATATSTDSSATAYGVRLGSALSGSFTNSGDISATANSSDSGASAYGVYVGGDLSGTLTNTSSGTISADMTLNGSRYFGVEASGVYVSGELFGALTNAGSISATATVNASRYFGVEAHGVYVSGELSGVLTNSGSISATATVNAAGSSASGEVYGVYVGSGLTGSLVNTSTGSISATVTANQIDDRAYGIYLGGSIDVDAVLSNAGVITASATVDEDQTAYAYGIYTSGSLSGAITNTSSGSITATATAGTTNDAYAYGIYASNGVDTTGSIVNNGTISATAKAGSSSDYGYAEAYGVYVNGTVDGSITNSGNISALVDHGTADAQIYGSAYGIYTGSVSSDGSITNSGTISAISKGYVTSDHYAYGIYVSGDLDGILTNTNSGTISATAVSDGKEGTAYGVYISGSLNNELNNSGKISATASATQSDVYAYGVRVSGMLDGVLTNDGSITANTTANSNSSQEAYAYGVYVSSGLTGELVNTGSITATADGSDGGAVYGIYVAGKGGLMGTITNSGTISVAGLGGVSSDDAYAIYANSGSGSIINEVTGVIEGRLRAFDGSVSVENAGLIDIGTTESYVGGNYTQATTGTLRIAAVDTGNYGTLTVGGTATLAANANIYVKVDSASTLAAGDTLSGVVSADTLSATTFAVKDNSFALNFSAEVNGDDVDLTTSTGAGSSAAAVVAGTGNSGLGGVAALLDSLNGTTSNTDLQDFIDSLASLGSAKEVADAMEQALPALAGSMAEASKGARTGTNRAVQARQDSLKGLSSGDIFLGDRQFWFKPVGSWTDQDDRKGVSGYEADTYGAVGGVDGEISDKSRIGLAFSYMHTNVDGNSSVADQHANVKSYQGIVYGSYSLDERTDFDWQADISLNKNDTRRVINVLGTDRVASADYKSWIGHVGAGISRSFEMSPATTLTPGIRLDYTYIRDESYSEKGAGGLNLAVDSDNTDELILMAEGRLSHAVSDRATLTANLGVGYDALAERTSVTAAFTGGGAAFTTKGLDPSPVMVRGGAGLVVTNSSALEITARYDFEVREDFDNQTASVKFRMPF